MDIVFSNRVSARLFKECSRAVVQQQQYSETPIQLRKTIEDCLDNYFDQHEIVSTGFRKV